jgi:hypothetical protein
MQRSYSSAPGLLPLQERTTFVKRLRIARQQAARPPSSMWVDSEQPSTILPAAGHGAPSLQLVSHVPTGENAGRDSPTRPTALTPQGRADQADCEPLLNAGLSGDSCPDGPFVPTVGVSKKQGLAIKALIDAGKGPSATVDVPTDLSKFQLYG